MKKKITLIVTLVFLLASIAYGQEQIFEDIERELVFVLDRSVYMTRDELEMAKKDILDLSREYLATHESYVSLVSYGSWARIELTATRDLSSIEDALEGIYPLGFSNVTDGLEKAKAILTSRSKDIILISNFYPNVGGLSSQGRYSSKDHFYYRNGNKLLEVAEDIRETDRIYTIYSTEKLNNKDTYFTNRIYEDISDYSFNLALREDRQALIEDIKDLLIYDLDIEREELEKNPIIFIPGIVGSELFTLDPGHNLGEFEESIGSIFGQEAENAVRVFIPLAQDKEFIRTSLDLDNKTYGLQQGNLHDIDLLNLHSGPMGIYYPLLSSLMKNFPDREVYLFSYDWRQSNLETRDKLNNFINYINQGEDRKVDLIGHSMGGLVIAHYLEEYDNKVDRVATFGTPFEGAPMAYNTLILERLMGDFEDVLIEFFVGVESSSTNKYPSIRELLTSPLLDEKYPLQLVSNEEIYNKLLENSNYYISNLKTNSLEFEKIVKMTKGLAISRDFNLEERDSFMVDKIGESAYDSFVKNSSLYREDGRRDGRVKLLERDRSRFFVSRGFKTDISAYIIEEDGGYKILDTISSMEGDSMVPLYSATMGLELDEMPSYIRDKFIMAKGSHIGMLFNPSNLKELSEFLNQ